jgi:hypothetical protein
MTNSRVKVMTVSTERSGGTAAPTAAARAAALAPHSARATCGCMADRTQGPLGRPSPHRHGTRRASGERGERLRDATIELHFDAQVLESLGLGGRSDTSLYYLAQETWDALALTQESFIESATILPFGVDREDAAYARIAEWERNYGRDVWVFALPSPDEPPLHAAAIPRRDTCRSSQRCHEGAARLAGAP